MIIPEDSTELELRPGGVTGMFFGGSGGGAKRKDDSHFALITWGNDNNAFYLMALFKTPKVTSQTDKE